MTANRLRIGVDGYNLAIPAGTGVASYARALCRAIDGLGHGLDLIYGVGVPGGTPPEMRESLFYSALGHQLALGEKPRMTFKRRMVRAAMLPTVRKPLRVPIDGKVIARDFAGQIPPAERLFTRSGLFDTAVRYFRRYGKPLRIRIPDPPAIMHWTYPVPVEMEGARNVYTLHDLVPLVMPYASLEDKGYYARLIRWLLDHADGICTVSEASKADIVRLFGVAPDRIANLYQAADMAAARPDESDEALATWLRTVFALEHQGYFLFAGAIEPKKNVGRLIEAYLQSGVETPLVIVGREGWRAEGELRLLRGGHGATLEGASRIRRVDYLPRAALMRLIRGARAVLFPSLYEGFGLPVLEAMTLGVPVITSNTSSLPELVGDAAMLVDPYDSEAMADAIRRIDGDSALRQDYAVLGRSRADAFSAARFEQRIDQYYRRLLEEKDSR